MNLEPIKTNYDETNCKYLKASRHWFIQLEYGPAHSLALLTDNKVLQAQIFLSDRLVTSVVRGIAPSIVGLRWAGVGRPYVNVALVYIYWLLFFNVINFKERTSSFNLISECLDSAEWDTCMSIKGATITRGFKLVPALNTIVEIVTWYPTYYTTPTFRERF